MNACPDKQTIHKWLECDLPPDQFTSVGKHIEGCERCRDIALSAPGLADAAGGFLRWLQRGAGRTEECLSYSDLVGHMEGSLSAEAAERVRDHVKTCPECEVDLKSVAEFRASRLERQPKQFSPTPARPGILSGMGFDWRTWTRAGRLVPAFGAAAVVVVAVISLAVLWGGREGPVPGIPQFRGVGEAEFAITSPSQPTIRDRRPLFQWSDYDHPDGVVYEVELVQQVDPSPEFPSGMKPVVEPVKTTETSARFDARLEAGPLYLFKVSATIGAKEPRPVAAVAAIYFRCVD